MNEIYLWVIFSGVIILGMISFYLLAKNYNLKDLFKPTPLYHYPALSDKSFNELNGIVKKIGDLDISSKEIILSKLWGRPIRVTKAIFPDGSHYLECVAPFSFNDEADFNFHYDENKNQKEDRSEIG